MHSSLSTRSLSKSKVSWRAIASCAVLVATAGSLSAMHTQSTAARAAAVRVRVDPCRAFVTNSTAGTVSVIDTSSDSVLATIPVGANPGSPAVSPDASRVYVPNTGSDTVSVLDVGTSSVLGTIAVADAPTCVVVTPDGDRAYVGCGSGLVSVIDTAIGATVAVVSVGAPATGSVGGLAISPDGAHVYALWGDLVVVDTATDTVVGSLYAGNTTTGLAVSPDGSRVYVSCAFGYGAFSFYGAVTVVDVAANAVSGVIGTWALPTSIAIAPDGAFAYASCPSTFVNTGYGMGYLPSPWVSRIDLATNTLSGGTNVGSAARGLGVTPDGSRVYVAVAASNAVKVIDRATDAVSATIAVGVGPNGLAIAR